MAEAPSKRLAYLALVLGLGATALVSVAVTREIVRAPVPDVRESAVEEAGAAVAGRVVEAADVSRLYDAALLTAATDPARAVGIEVNDEAVRRALGLETGDVITAIAGKPVRTVIDVGTVLASVQRLDATSVYLEVQRGGHPRLLEWKLVGQLRVIPPRAPMAGTDPLLASITMHSDTDITLPRATFDRIARDVVATTGTGWTAGMRVIPSAGGGMRLFGVRPGTVWSALGFRTGDIIHRANGEAVSVATLRDDFDRVRNATSIELAMTRNGGSVTIRYSIR